MAANQKYQILPFQFGALDNLNKARCIDYSSTGIEKNLTSAGMFCEKIDALRINLTHLARCVAASSFDELGGNRVGVRIAWFADEIDKNLHDVSRMQPKMLVLI